MLFLVKGISGGTATLSYRIGQKFKDEGFDVIYIYDILNDTNNEKMFAEAGFTLLRVCENKWKSTIIHNCENYENAILITYTIDNFVLIDRIVVKNVNIHKYLYVVSTASIIRGASKGRISRIDNVICKLLNYLDRKYINSIYINKQLLFMDDVTIKVARQNLMLPFEDAEKNIFLLPYAVKVKPDFQYKKDNIILTMSRVSFPFKAYLLGLLDAFTRLIEEMPCELWVIGDGESKETLREKIESLPDSVKRHIKMIDSVSYDKVGQILQKGKVFIGMGTSILDASSNGVPSLAVAEYRADCVGKGWFINYPQYVGFSRNDNELSSLDRFLVSVFSMDEQEYVNLSIAHYKCVVDYYSMDSFYYRINENTTKSMHLRNKNSFWPIVINKILDARKKLSFIK